MEKVMNESDQIKEPEMPKNIRVKYVEDEAMKIIGTTDRDVFRIYAAVLAGEFAKHNPETAKENFNNLAAKIKDKILY